MESKETIFNEAALQAAINKTFGEFGAHAEVFRILTTQRDGYKEQFNEQKRLFDSSQEEVKRLKEEKEAQEFKFGQVTGDQFKKIEELEERVKELTENNNWLQNVMASMQNQKE
jgi:hypothetical protein